MGLSVIIPVYNGEKYIEECVKSVINQSYTDLQIIIVNDGSTDNTEELVKKLMMSDSRIALINQSNRGVSSARNIGLNMANKEFITFVDGDDTIDEDMYELLMPYTDRFDIVHCGYKSIDRDNIKQVNGTGQIIIQDSREALECLIDGNLFVGSPWNKIYNKNLFEDIRFDENIKINEDILVNYKLFKKSKKSIFIDIAKYNYYKRSQSICNITSWVKKYEDSNKVAKIIYEDCKGSVLEINSANKYFRSLISLYRAYYYDRNKKYKEIKKKINQFYKENIIINRNDNISAVLIKYCPHFYGIFYKVYDKIRVPNWDV